MNGRGAHDMKQGVSAMVFAMDALRSAGLAPAADVYVQTVTEEECTGNGALSTLARGYRADACLIPEPTANSITARPCGRDVVPPAGARRAGACRAGANRQQRHPVRVRVDPGLPEAHRRHQPARADRIRWFKDVPDPIKFNPGVIHGGDWGSSTPAWCEVDCRIGLLPGTTLEAARQQVIDTVRRAAAADGFMSNNQPEVIWNGFQADGFLLEPGSEAEAMLAASHQEVFGAKMEARLSTAVNDTRFYGLYYGMPALCYGPGGEGAHAFDERADLATLKQTTLAIAGFIARWCGTRPL